jgi:hypothetical protein
MMPQQTLEEEDYERELKVVERYDDYNEIFD